MDTAVFSVVYPAMEVYFPEFLSTLSKQTDRNFTVFLINDGLPNIEDFLKRADLDVKVKEAQESPAALRKIGLRWVQEAGAKNIIFADSDDYFAKNRVEISRDILVKYDLVFNELVLTGKGVTDSTPMLGTYFSDGEVVSCKHIGTGNCMGLSNTALRVNSIPSYFDQIPENIIAFDWAFFALCLHDGAKAIFTNNTQTWYRQHGNNLASPHSFTEEQILRGVQVKRDHYQMLSRFYEEYVPLADIFEKLLMQLQSNEILRQKYCRAVRKHAPAMPLWWEPIKSLKELGL
jgi:glycosyltransferase involved in cell wall biosynthesis